MNDRARAEELLAQAWQHQPRRELERVEILLSALVHAVLAVAPNSDVTLPGEAAASSTAPALEDLFANLAA